MGYSLLMASGMTLYAVVAENYLYARHCGLPECFHPVCAHSESADHTCWVRGDATTHLEFDVPLYFYGALALTSLAYAYMRLRHASFVRAD